MKLTTSVAVLWFVAASPTAMAFFSCAPQDYGQIKDRLQVEGARSLAYDYCEANRYYESNTRMANLATSYGQAAEERAAQRQADDCAANRDKIGTALATAKKTAALSWAKKGCAGDVPPELRK